MSSSLLFRSILLLSAWPDLVHICVQPLGGRQREEDKELLFKDVPWKLYTRIPVVQKLVTWP